MGTISKNFDYREFEASDTARSYHLDNTITDFTVRDSVKALVDEVLQPLRDAWGGPLHINSGYRSYQVNVLVGGTPTSQHRKGEAADVACDNPLRLAQLAKDLGLPYDQMILYPSFVHFSHKLRGEQRRQILYNVRYTGRKVK